MKRRGRIVKYQSRNHAKAIKDLADRQIVWARCIPALKKYDLQSVDSLTMSGDAPKDFVIDQEYRPGHRSKSNPKDRFIAKVGSKFYPLESIVEHLITRIGQCYGLRIADSKLRLIDGQVRFLSKFFLRKGQQLTHGAEIYASCLGKKDYAELAEAKNEKHFFSFEMTCEAIQTVFPDNADSIIPAYVEMLAFDALIGHNDRHPYNWGVIVPVKLSQRPRFSPVFDTARALFWNISEETVKKMLTNTMQFEAYVNKAIPSVCWDKEQVDFFEFNRANLEKTTMLIVHASKGICWKSVSMMLKRF